MLYFVVIRVFVSAMLCILLNYGVRIHYTRSYLQVNFRIAEICWRKSNFIDILEPDFPYHYVLAPFQPLAMKTIYCPIETSLNFQQANKLLKDLKPGNIVIPESYTQPPIMAPHKTDLVIDQVSTGNFSRPVSLSFSFFQMLNFRDKRPQFLLTYHLC